MESIITVAAVAITDRNGRILTVRKKGTQLFQFPGGKPEPGESMLTAACREVTEEIGLHLRRDHLHYLGRFDAPAANEANHVVRATVFTYPAEFIAPENLPRDGSREARAEIAEVWWASANLEPAGDRKELAPLLCDRVFPAMAVASTMSYPAHLRGTTQSPAPREDLSGFHRTCHTVTRSFSSREEAERALRRASRRLLTGEVHRAAGAPITPGGRMQAGDRVTIQAGGFRAPCLVLDATELSHGASLMYGTLPGHPLSGEELFEMEVQRKEDASECVLHASVRAVSRAGTWYTMIGGPVVRAVQRWMAARYAQAMLE